jgi:hypothetical protein
MRSLQEFDAFWQGALIWNDPLTVDEQKTALTRAYFGLEFQCRHAISDSERGIVCLEDGFHCCCRSDVDYMSECLSFAQMPCNLREIIKAQSLQSQAIITQEPKESCASKATIIPEVLGEEYRGDT